MIGNEMLTYHAWTEDLASSSNIQLEILR